MLTPVTKMCLDDSLHSQIPIGPVQGLVGLDCLTLNDGCV